MHSGYTALKETLESVYACLNITCEEVGGIVDLASAGPHYYPGAEPCVTPSDSSSSQDQDQTALVIALVCVSAVVLISCIVAVWCAMRARRYRKLGETSVFP